MKHTLLLITFLFTLQVFSQSGNLDTSFGTNGKVHTGSGTGNGKANAVAVQPDGKIIVGGAVYTANTVNSWEKDANNATLVRYNANGSIDTTFGNDGIVMTDYYTFAGTGNWNSGILSIILQSDGKILAYGSRSQDGAGSSLVIVRYNTDGSLDYGFGYNGRIDATSGAVDGATTLLLQPDGKILVLSAQYLNPSPGIYSSQFVVERYTANGSYDINFGTDGRVVTAFGSGYDMPAAMALQPDGKIVAVGSTISGNYHLAVARYTANGALDTTFDGDGKIITSLGTGVNSIAHFVTIHPDGSIVVTGTTGGNFTLVQYNTNGSLNTGFNGDGVAINAFDANDISNTINSVSEQPDGKFLITTSAYPYDSYDQADDFVTRRYNSDGTTDASFGINGKVATACRPGFNNAKKIAVQPNGKILVVGYSHALASQQNVFSAARYESNGNLDTAFNASGTVIATFDSSNDDSPIVVLQPDDKLISIGIKKNQLSNTYLPTQDIALSRYNNNGTLDASFGTGGKVISSFGQNINKITKAALLPDGKIAVSNTYYNPFADNLYHYELIRYTANGSIDTTFGADGKVTVDTETSVLLSQPDGKIVTMSMGNDAQNNATLTLKRFNTNGTPDGGFGNAGTTGIAVTPIGPPVAQIQPDGKIVVSYSSPDSNGVIGLVVKRFNPNGSIDSGFVNNITTVDNGVYSHTVFILPDGKIIVTGRSVGYDNVPFYQFAAVQFNVNGSLDTTYGTNGVVTADLGSVYEPYNLIQAVLYQPDGKFLVALSKVEQTPATPTPDLYDFVISRFTASGAYDNDFGVNGKVITAFYNKYDEAFSMVLQSDNKIVVAGTTDTGINRDFALARYDNTIALDTKGVTLNTGLILYPNPVKDIVTVKMPRDNELTMSNIIICNMLGQTVYSKDKSSYTIDIRDLQTGVYLLNVKTNKGNWSTKFIKE